MIYLYISALFNLDIRTKLATIATPIATIWIGRKVSEKINIGQSVYQKREIIYRNLFKKIELFYGPIVQYGKEAEYKIMMRKKYEDLKSYTIFNKLYFSSNLGKNITTLQNISSSTIVQIENYDGKDSIQDRIEKLNDELKDIKNKIENQIKKELKIK